jgi:hypothetical protein
MDMRMVQRFLVLGMQHAEEASVRPNAVSRREHRQELVGAGPKQTSP